MPMAERCSRFAESRDKALELFANKGFGQVGMRELASHLGLTPGSLYHHYPSKQHLLADLIEEFFSRSCWPPSGALNSNPGTSAATCNG
nr:hypothetical protein GCM10020185_85320 [Pseudomonas brassicacearum subsp. brassicacearum]